MLDYGNYNSASTGLPVEFPITLLSTKQEY